MRDVKITYINGTVEQFSIPSDTEADFLKALPFDQIAALDMETIA